MSLFNGQCRSMDIVHCRNGIDLEDMLVAICCLIACCTELLLDLVVNFGDVSLVCWWIDLLVDRMVVLDLFIG